MGTACPALLYSRATDTCCPILVWFDLAALSILCLFEFRESYAVASRIITERVTITSGEWRIAGDLVLPQRGSDLAAVIMLNKAAGDRNAYKGLAESLALRGIASLRIDLRGHGESTNRGRFVPGEGRAIIERSDEDVVAAHEFLKKQERIAPKRIGFVGASYSGEAMMQAARSSEYGAAYVGLSPGSLSDESIASIDREKLPWLLVVSRHERYLKEAAQAFRDQSRTGEFLEVGGTRHATDILAEHSEMADLIAEWFRIRLVSHSR